MMHDAGRKFENTDRIGGDFSKNAVCSELVNKIHSATYRAISENGWIDVFSKQGFDIFVFKELSPKTGVFGQALDSKQGNTRPKWRQGIFTGVKCSVSGAERKPVFPRQIPHRAHLGLGDLLVP